MQLLWCSFDCQASISFWWSTGEGDGRCHTRTKDDICNVRAITVPLTDVFFFLILLRSAALVGVLASTGSCEFSFRHPSPHPYRCRSTDTLLRAIGKRANALHVNAYFSSQCVLISAIGYVPRVGLFSD